jgi:hypothetical protein
LFRVDWLPKPAWRTVTVESMYCGRGVACDDERFAFRSEHLPYRVQDLLSRRAIGQVIVGDEEIEIRTGANAIEGIGERADRSDPVPFGGEEQARGAPHARVVLNEQDMVRIVHGCAKPMKEQHLILILPAAKVDLAPPDCRKLGRSMPCVRSGRERARGSTM